MASQRVTRWKVVLFTERTSNISTGVLSGVVQFFKEESSNILVGGDGEFPARPERTNSHTVQHANLPLLHSPSTILSVPKSSIVLIQFLQRKKSLIYWETEEYG